MRRLPRRPPEQLPFGIARVPLHAAGVARLGIARIELPRRSRAIDAEVRVMDDARVARTEFERAHVARTPTGIGITNVRNTSAPSAGTVYASGILTTRSGGPRRQPSAQAAAEEESATVSPCWSAVRDPPLQLLQFIVGEPALVLELALARVRFPRRHDPSRGDRRDLRRATSDIVVGQEREWSDFAGTMAGRAAMPHDRRDVFVEGERRLRLSHRRTGTKTSPSTGRASTQTQRKRKRLCVLRALRG